MKMLSLVMHFIRMRRKARIFILGAFACLYIFHTRYFMMERGLENTLLSFEFRNLSEHSLTNKLSVPMCLQERTNFVFIKCMKCATESLELFSEDSVIKDISTLLFQ